MQLHDVDVVGSEPERLPSALGHLRQSVVVVELTVARSGHRSHEARRGPRCAYGRAAEHQGGRAVSERTAHQAPQDARHLGGRQDLVDGDPPLELGQGIPRRVVEGLGGGTGDLAKRRARLGHQPSGPGVVEAHEDAAGRVVGVGPSCVQVVPVLRRQAVFDPCDGLAAVPGQHLLDAEGKHRAVPDGGGHRRQVQGRAPTRTRVVDVDDRRLAEPGLAQPALAAHATLVAQTAGHRVAEDHEPQLLGRHAGVTERLERHLVGHGLEGEVPPAHVGHAGAQDGHVRPDHARGSGQHRLLSGGEGLMKQCEVVHGGPTRNHDHDVARPGLPVGAQALGAARRCPGDEMSAERLGRKAIELRQPCRAALGGLSVFADTGEDHHGGLDHVGVAPAPGRLFPQGRQRSGVLVGRHEEGNPSVAHPSGAPNGRGTVPAEPERHPARPGFLDVRDASPWRRGVLPGRPAPPTRPPAGGPRRRPWCGPAV